VDQSDRDFRAGSASIFSSVWPRSEVCGNHLIPDTPAAARGHRPEWHNLMFGFESCVNLFPSGRFVRSGPTVPGGEPAAAGMVQSVTALGPAGACGSPGTGAWQPSLGITGGVEAVDQAVCAAAGVPHVAAPYRPSRSFPPSCRKPAPSKPAPPPPAAAARGCDRSVSRFLPRHPW
jgi:hypothetical protein